MKQLKKCDHNKHLEPGGLSLRGHSTMCGESQYVKGGNVGALSVKCFSSMRYTRTTAQILISNVYSGLYRARRYHSLVQRETKRGILLHVVCHLNFGALLRIACRNKVNARSEMISGSKKAREKARTQFKRRLRCAKPQLLVRIECVTWSKRNDFH